MGEVKVIQGNFSPEYLEWRRLRSALETTGGDPFSVFVRLDRVLDGGAWSRLDASEGGRFKTFESFVNDPEKGLGMTRQELDGLLEVVGETEKRGQHGDLFVRVRERVERAWREEVPSVGKHGTNQYAPDSGDGGTDSTRGKRGQVDGILARLKRDDPQLAQAVIDGQLTANAAARMKGWRKPRILLTTPESVAKRIREHYNPEEITELINHLGGESP